MPRFAFWSLAGIAAVALACYAWRNPVYDWDMLAYAAVQYKSEGLNDAQVHAKIYDDVLPGCGAEVHDFLTEVPYEKHCAASADFFASQLPFYAIKPLYNALIYFMVKCGCTPLEAMRLLSALAYAVVVIVVMSLVRRYDKSWFAFVGGALVCAVPVVLTPARMLTPDMLSTALLLSALCVYLVGRNVHVMMLLLLLSIGVRPDNAATALIALGAITIGEREWLRPSVGAAYGVVALASYLCIGYFFHAYGWEITFQHSVLDVAKPVDEWKQLPLTVVGYAKTLALQIIHDKPLLAPIAMLALASYMASKSLTELNKAWHGAWWVAAFSMMVKYAAFPRTDLRYYVPHFVFACLTLLLALRRYSQNHVTTQWLPRNVS